VASLVERLGKGETGAYVSDAGTPGIADPGAELAAAAAAAGIAVYPVPGANAAAALLSVSGFPASEFHFRGFFPREKKEREEWARAARVSGGIQVFFESPHRIRECLASLAEHFPAAELVVGRELTKKFEEITRGSARAVHELLQAKEPRGEYVLALRLPGAAGETTARLAEAEIHALLAEIAGLGANQKTLVRVAMSHGMKKNGAYTLALEILGK
jgi:16S rRNA (cytidine1402-2'-O)-methyltransferase